MTNEVRSSLESGILTITIDRPDQRNALNGGVLSGLREAFREAALNREVRVVTLTGAGEKVFCAGADLKASLSTETNVEAFRQGDYRKLLMDILHYPKPTVALARGHVMAGGLGLLLACDLALACDDIHFSTPEIHVGVFPMMVLALLYRHVGRKKATEMMFLGERIPAATARDLGIVNYVYPRAQFSVEAAQLVLKLTEKSSSILGMGKRAIWRIESPALQEELESLESALAEVMSCADSREGMRAFLEKRRPRWKDE